MAIRSRRGGGNGLEAWPGYVDALSTLLMVVMFVLLVFVLAQAFESVILKQRNDQLTAVNQTLTQVEARNEALRGDVSKLNEDLAAGSAARAALLEQLRVLNTQTANALSERDRLAALLHEVEISAAATAAANKTLTANLDEATRRAADAEARAEALNLTVKADKEAIEAKMADLANLVRQVAALTAMRDDLAKQVSAQQAAAMTEADRRKAIEAQLQDQAKLGDTAKAQIALLTQQVAQLRAELAASEKMAADEREKAGSLTAQLNLALAAQVEELRKYRSDFFGRLRDVLAGRPGVQIVGDRFVFQSEVLFKQGSADLSPAGMAQMTDLAETFRGIIEKIPPDVNWILRVDGHTDATPVHNGRFPSNWELSAARAITVVRFLTARGIPATHLAATGFGEYQPVDPANTPEAFAKNRRIELRLTDR
jgi:chemotaxis protein MotB